MNNIIGLGLKELAGLFVDDGMLALAIAAVVAVAAVVATFVPATPLAAGAVLLAGCPAVLLINVLGRGPG